MRALDLADLYKFVISLSVFMSNIFFIFLLPVRDDGCQIWLSIAKFGDFSFRQVMFFVFLFFPCNDLNVHYNNDYMSPLGNYAFSCIDARHYTVRVWVLGKECLRNNYTRISSTAAP